MSKILIIGCSGYIGSYLTEAMINNGDKVSGCDILAPLKMDYYENFYDYSYEKIEIEELREFDLILWFAGHSSVKKANEDPVGAIRNNLINLFILIEKLSISNTPIIYASSASVYSSDDYNFNLTASEKTSNVYDAGKLSLDIIAPYCGAKTLALRLSTMSGWSPKIREDLIFNAMNISAKKEGLVRVQNASSFRSILFLDDLAKYIIEKKINFECRDKISIKPIGLSSWSGTIGQLAIEVAAYWKVPVVYGESHGTYSFVISDHKLKECTKNDSEFYKTIAERCKQFENYGKVE